MKKLILVAFLMVFAGFCFAQEGESAQTEKPDKFIMEITAGVSVNSVHSPTPHDFGAPGSIDKTMTANTALGFSMVFPLHKFVGFALDTDFFFSSDLTGHSRPQSASISLFGANAFLGPVIYLYRYQFIRIPLALGVHMSYWDSTTWQSTLNAPPGTGWLRSQDLQVGPGLYTGIHFYFTPNVYMVSRASFAVDVFRWHKSQVSNGSVVSDNDETELAIGWRVKPSIGVGMMF